MYENVASAKLIASGTIFEFFLYDTDVYSEEKKRKKVLRDYVKREIALSDEDKIVVRRGSVLRSARSLRRIINANVNAYQNPLTHKFYKPVFLTLTFARNETDIDYANECFTLFIKRVNYFLYGGKVSRLKYVAALEFQERGAVHYHLVMFNLPYINDVKQVFQDLWKQGFVVIRAINEIDNVASYVTKYMTKGAIDVRLMGKKFYQASQGLYKPHVETDFFKIAELLKIIPDHMDFAKDLESDFVGKFKYIRIDVSRLGLDVLRYINRGYVGKPVDNLELTSDIQGVLF